MNATTKGNPTQEKIGRSRGSKAVGPATSFAQAYRSMISHHWLLFDKAELIIEGPGNWDIHRLTRM